MTPQSERKHLIIHLLYSIIFTGTITALSLPFHEYGHAVVCTYIGLTPQITIDLFNAKVYCESIPVNEYFLYRVMGGGIVVLVCLPFLVFRQIRTHVIFGAGLTALTLWSVVNAIWESMFFKSYISMPLINLSISSFFNHISHRMWTYNLPS